MPKEKARVPQPFRHHNPDGSVNEDSLFDVSRRFMYIRQQVSMAPTEIIALANHLCAHFDMRGMTAPPPIQAIRTSVRVRNDSKTNNDSSTRTHHPVLSRFPKKTLPDKAHDVGGLIIHTPDVLSHLPLAETTEVTPC